MTVFELGEIVEEMVPLTLEYESGIQSTMSYALHSGVDNLRVHETKVVNLNAFAEKIKRDINLTNVELIRACIEAIASCPNDSVHSEVEAVEVYLVDWLAPIFDHYGQAGLIDDKLMFLAKELFYGIQDKVGGFDLLGWSKDFKLVVTSISYDVEEVVGTEDVIY